jgi:restriction system protein
MAVWLVRAGAHGEFEQRFIQEKRVYVTWDGLDVDLSKLDKPAALNAEMTKRYPDDKAKRILNWVSQVWPFAHSMQAGDLVVLPLRIQPGIQIGEITGDYHFEPAGPNPYYHWRPVKWIGEPAPRANFGKDLLYSFGAFMTICRIQRNDAEARLAAMRASGWKPEPLAAVAQAAAPQPPIATDESLPDIDLEEQALDGIAKAIEARFKGHGLTRLVDAILRAQGYMTYVSPEGPDGGVDILAGSGPLGFTAPRLCVEVKSGAAPIDRPTVDKLLGAVRKFQAQEALFVSWGGFKPNVQKELASQFFCMRLWSRKDLLEQLFLNYDRLDADLRAELPLKRIWTLAAQEEAA